MLHREFSRESASESILILGSHLPKLLSNIKWLLFLGHSVDRLLILTSDRASYKSFGTGVIWGVWLAMTPCNKILISTLVSAINTVNSVSHHHRLKFPTQVQGLNSW